VQFEENLGGQMNELMESLAKECSNVFAVGIMTIVLLVIFLSMRRR